MKKVTLCAIVATATAMTACSDYKAQINDAHEEYWRSINNGNEMSSGCQCYISDNPVYDYASMPHETPITWRVNGCKDNFNFQAGLDQSTSSNNIAGALVSNAVKEGLDYKVDVIVTVGGPYFQTNVGIYVDVSNMGGAFIEKLECGPAVVMGIE